jgi:hypothetical protein
MKMHRDRMKGNPSYEKKNTAPADPSSALNSGFFAPPQASLDPAWSNAQWFKDWERAARRET